MEQHATFPIIAGPTAGGKSALAVAVAIALRDQGLPAEIITADSVQVFREMDIGSAKPTPEERRGVPHHLIDVVDPADAFTVDQWLGLAEQTISRLRSRSVLPIVVGGTHLYLKALMDGLFDGPEPDQALRAELRSMAAGARRAMLEESDPAAAARIHPNDERRTVRALEVFLQTGRPISEHQQQWDRTTRTDCLLIGLVWDPELLNRRINARCRAMMDIGLLDEVRSLHARSRFGRQSGEALGYKQILSHLRGECSLPDAVERIKIETRRFAKNQRTWLRRLRSAPHSLWIDMNEGSAEDAARRLAGEMINRRKSH